MARYLLALAQLLVQFFPDEMSSLWTISVNTEDDTT